jgi:hypothetical protein
MDMNLQWRKATYSSSNGGNCIEVATADRTVAVRDSKDPDGPRLAFGPAAWSVFGAQVKADPPEQLSPALQQRVLGSDDGGGAEDLAGGDQPG